MKSLLATLLAGAIAFQIILIFAVVTGQEPLNGMIFFAGLMGFLYLCELFERIL